MALMLSPLDRPESVAARLLLHPLTGISSPSINNHGPSTFVAVSGVVLASLMPYEYGTLLGFLTATERWPFFSES